MSTTILHGDCRQLLKTLPDQSVQCVVTSPPYYGLRDYGTAQWEGGDSACDHQPAPHQGTTGMLAGRNPAAKRVHRDICARRGAIRIDSQIGLEATPADYVTVLLEVFREVHRVLREDGTLWLNLGDSYANDTKWGGATSGKHAGRLHGDTGIGRRRHTTGLPGKNLIGIPWRVAFALQDDGWILRSDIIWSKPNAMPESVEDRPTRSHEYLFLLSKSRNYYYNAEAIAEPAAQSSQERAYLGKRPVSERQQTMQAEGLHGKSDTLRVYDRATRNRRTVWSVATRPYSGAHFAVMPEALCEPARMAGSRPGDVVLDPFGGSGTVGRVAEGLQRDAILIELNPNYIELAERRTNGVQLVATELLV